MMPIDGDQIWQPSLVPRRLLKEHLCFQGQKEGRKREQTSIPIIAKSSHPYL